MTGQTITDLLARWATPEGRPFKGKLIDWTAYQGDGLEPPKDIGCMCAQGQALHILAGWTPRDLKDTSQVFADGVTAKLLNISRTHAVLLRLINDTIDGAPSIVLTNPEKIIGDQAKVILSFWLFLDKITPKQRRSLAATRDATWDAARDVAWNAAAWDAAARSAVRRAIRGTTSGTTWASAAWASNEIQGTSVMRQQSKPFFFLPMFGFATPEDIPPLPDDYANGVMR
jgi:hypothetical protein